MASENNERLRLIIRGAVQGVGFRPFIYRLAQELHLNGWVRNTSAGVLIEVEGLLSCLQELLLRIGKERPASAVIQGMEPVFLDPVGYEGFEIKESVLGTVKAWVLPDMAVCPDCRREIMDPKDRRFHYPFTNCTHCGPRYSIIERLPYDRGNTSMKRFFMCPACSSEYHDPKDRRFHAQPNACPACGPRLQIWDAQGVVLKEGDAALAAAGDLVRQGKIVAVKGVGGFHLICDASRDAAVRMLRERKRRQGKPFALMFPDLAAVKKACCVDVLEERLLMSPEAPIVLLRRHEGLSLSAHVAPGNPYLGVMLPYTPVHILLLDDLGFPVVATSGNLSEETICIDEHEALERLQGIADAFLVHDRPVVRAVDDSVARVILGKEQILRRARGYAPLPIVIDQDFPLTLAVGGHVKNCVALARGKEVFVSQHIGDLETIQSLDAFARVIKDLSVLYEVAPERVVCDLHPDYHSTQAARGTGLPLTQVQHHQAHVLSCMADNAIVPPVLGVSWDGSGFGPDGTVWGGEFLIAGEQGVERFACFEPFLLPGGEAAVREPRRSLLGALYAAFGEKVFEKDLKAHLRGFDEKELLALKQMLARQINSPRTSSAGRCFDAVAALVGLCDVSSFEGQAAMALEFVLPQELVKERYSFSILDGKGSARFMAKVFPWDEMFADLKRQVPVSIISAKFHNMLLDVIVWAAREAQIERVALTGGCFQNRYLTEQADQHLRAAGFKPYIHQRVPPNDGGIALGQVMALAHISRSNLGSFNAH